jgi:hypothetical protein
MNELATNNSTQNLTTYLPSRAGRKLLEILLNPEHRFKTTTEVCKLAGISRDRYYDLLKDKRFICHYTKESQKLVKMSQGPIVNALIKSAVRGNPQNLKTALTMADLYKEKTGLVINPDADGNPQPVRIQSDMELAVKVARLIHILLSNPKVRETIEARLKSRENGITEGTDGLDSGTGKIEIPGLR